MAVFFCTSTGLWSNCAQVPKETNLCLVGWLEKPTFFIEGAGATRISWLGTIGLLVIFLDHSLEVHSLFCACLDTTCSWLSYVWHFRMVFETPYRVQAVLKMTSMNIWVWKAFHRPILSAHRMVMEVLRQKIHLFFPALPRLPRSIPRLFISPPGQAAWGLLEEKAGCLQDGKY